MPAGSGIIGFNRHSIFAAADWVKLFSLLLSTEDKKNHNQSGVLVALGEGYAFY